MERFESLPLEMRLKIADAMPPRDLCHFAATCRLYWGLHESAVREYKRLYYKHGRVVARDSRDNAIWDLLLNILKDPTYRVAESVQELALPSDRETYSRYPVGGLKEPMELWEAIQENPLLQDSVMWSPFMDQMGNIRSENPCLAVLLTLLPNLRRLDYWMDGPAQGLEFQRVLQRIASAYIHSIRPLPLQNLNQVHLCASLVTDFDFVDLQLVMHFAQISSVRSILAENVRSYDREIAEDMTKIKSNVNRLYFPWGNISTLDWRLLLSNIDSLEHLHYASVETTLSDGLSDHRVILKALLEFAKHSLQSVKLCGERYDEVVS